MTEQILAVQKMQDYIEAHLTEEITLAFGRYLQLFPLVCPSTVSGAHRLRSCGVYPSAAAGKVCSAFKDGTRQDH